jgi:RNA-directed DNA polymerase
MTNHPPKPRVIASKARLRDVWKYSSDAKGRGSSPGSDGVSPKQFRGTLEKNLESIHQDIQGGTFQFSPLKAFPISKGNGKIRLICAPTVRDRLVQRLIVEYLVTGDKLGVKNNVSFGFVRDAGGVPAAVKAARRIREEYPWALKSDITSFFDRIQRTPLALHLEKTLGSSSILPLLLKTLDAEVDDKPLLVSGWLQNAGLKKGEGLRQGMPLSPLLSNFVLKTFDRHFEKKQAPLVRYADDFTIFAKSKLDCDAYLAETKGVLAKLGHDVPDPGPNSKTVIATPDDAVDFLGYEIVKGASGAYDIVIPDHAFKNIRETLAKYHDLDGGIARYKTLDRMLQSLGSVAQSFASVYALGKNKVALRSHVENCRANAVTKIAEQLFGAEVISKMEDRKKKFLGLTLDPLDGDWQ